MGFVSANVRSLRRLFATSDRPAKSWHRPLCNFVWRSLREEKISQSFLWNDERNLYSLSASRHNCDINDWLWFLPAGRVSLVEKMGGERAAHGGKGRERRKRKRKRRKRIPIPGGRIPAGKGLRVDMSLSYALQQPGSEGKNTNENASEARGNCHPKPCLHTNHLSPKAVLP